MTFATRARLFTFGLLLALLPIPAQPPSNSQAVDANEQRIANLPPAQKSYERFRYWLTTLPAGERGAGPFDKYGVHLKSRGFTPSQIEAEIKLVRSQGNRAEIDRWNRILTAEKPTFNTKPNDFLVEVAAKYPKGSALDVGMGQGRNALWLAQQGWNVTGFDPAEQAVALAKASAAKLGVPLATHVTGTESFDFGDRRWDLILLSYVGTRGLTGKLQRALKPGGILIVEAFHRDATKGHSIGSGVVFDSGELVTLFPGLRVVRYEEPITKADFGQDLVRVVRYCGVRPE